MLIVLLTAIFRSTVVKTEKTYWVDVFSTELVYDAACVISTAAPRNAAQTASASPSVAQSAIPSVTPSAASAIVASWILVTMAAVSVGNWLT